MSNCSLSDPQRDLPLLPPPAIGPVVSLGAKLICLPIGIGISDMSVRFYVDFLKRNSAHVECLTKEVLGAVRGGAIMEFFDKAFDGIDHFFDSYDRIAPAGTTEVLVALATIGLCAALLL
jgi:hypothetical protein